MYCFAVHWRRNSIQVVLYLDDGFCVAEDQGMCSKHSDIAKKDIMLSGLVPNKDKCVWSPSQHLEIQVQYHLNTVSAPIKGLSTLENIYALD
jgi:hypothetical protein